MKSKFCQIFLKQANLVKLDSAEMVQSIEPRVKIKLGVKRYGIGTGAFYFHFRPNNIFFYEIETLIA